jgi:coenzyme F420-reducing hydrogenase beta subunit
MREDDEGFLYPEINDAICIQCSLCEKICPVLVLVNSRKPLYVYAAKNPDEPIRRESSSGGMFTLLAEAVILRGGVVFGARFNEKWEVIHDYTENKEGLAEFRGSKYVQSRIGNTYIQAREFLEAGRVVMFSGVPCQIAGLKGFLQKDYDNLVTVDLVCHGVPSPKVWQRYLYEVVEKIVTTPPTPQTEAA